MHRSLINFRFILVLVISSLTSRSLLFWVTGFLETFLRFWRFLLSDIQARIVTVFAADGHVVCYWWLRCSVLRSCMIRCSMLVFSILSVSNGWHVWNLFIRAALGLPVIAFDVCSWSSLHVILILSFQFVNPAFIWIIFKLLS